MAATVDSSAVVLGQLGQMPTIERVTVESPGPDEVCVQMSASGICHTDLSVVRDARACPLLLGHEGAGVVVKTGSKVAGIKEGDHVVINWQAKCGRCRSCLAGKQDFCEDIRSTEAPRVYWNKSPLQVMLNAGTFCPLVVVPATGAVPIRRDMPLKQAALLGCAVATGLGAVLYTARVRPGESVVVIGVGGVGLNVVQGARLSNSGIIVAVDVDEERLNLANRFGATHLISAQSADAVLEVMELTKGRGVEHVFEVVGEPRLMLQGIEMLARGGDLTLIGATARDAVLPFYPRRFMSR